MGRVKRAYGHWSISMKLNTISAALQPTLVLIEHLKSHGSIGIETVLNHS